MKKSSTSFLKILYSAVMLAISLFLITSCYNLILGTLFKGGHEETETHNIKDFWDKTYLEYNGGKDAEVFFNEFAYVENYKDIAFHYRDGKEQKSLHAKYYDHTVFVLDVYYERDVFLEVSDKILLELTTKSADDIFKLYDGKQKVAFSGYKVERDNGVYKENNASILFDPRYNTIRYVFLFNNTGTVFDARFAPIYVLGLRTNLSKKDWVFDYSDICSEDYTKSYYILY